MNIIFVTSEYIVRGKPTTGLPNYLQRVAMALVRYGHHPIIVTAGIADRHEIINGIEIYTKSVDNYDMKNDCLKYMVNAAVMGLALNAVVHKVCREKEIHIIQYTNLNGLGIFYHEKCPAVMRLSSYAKISHIKGASYSEWAIRAMALFERLSAKRMKRIFAPSHVVAREFSRDVQRKVSVIETPFINETQNLDESLLCTNLKGKRYILYFGILSAEKGVLVIKELLEKFLKTYPDYYFVFIGENRAFKSESCLKQIKQAAGECGNRVVYFPPLRHEQLYPFIKSADLIVLPSLFENLSNACIEAMYFGRIVIGTQGTSFEQLIKDGYNGFLSLPRDSKSLYDKIQEAISLTDGQRNEMETRAKERVDRLSPEHVVSRLVRFYESCMIKD